MTSEKQDLRQPHPARGNYLKPYFLLKPRGYALPLRLIFDRAARDVRARWPAPHAYSQFFLTTGASAVFFLKQYWVALYLLLMTQQEQVKPAAVRQLKDAVNLHASRLLNRESLGSLTRIPDDAPVLVVLAAGRGTR